MKTWNTPAIKELDIKETASGYLNLDWESPLNWLSKKAPATPDNSTQK